MAIGVGIVGCGMISNFHARAFEEIRGARVVACFDMVAPAADAFAERAGCTAYHKLNDLLADPAVDVVTICTPSGAHADPAVAAAKAELERLAGDVTSLRNELKEKDAQISVAAELEAKAKACPLLV